MSTTEVTAADVRSEGAAGLVVSDFSIQVATVNGSGSQTANTVPMRSLFQMGIPVAGKNLFPSNIAGLPAWFAIRASKHGWIGRKKPRAGRPTRWPTAWRTALKAMKTLWKSTPNG
jgi:2-oxoglutarate ferredoxin oxidoreductase subunit alpha